MNKTQVTLFLGIALMAWGGVSTGNAISKDTSQSANLAIFAIGIILISQSHISRLESRIDELEKRARLPRD